MTELVPGQIRRLTVDKPTQFSILNPGFLTLSVQVPGSSGRVDAVWEQEVRDDGKIKTITHGREVVDAGAGARSRSTKVNLKDKFKLTLTPQTPCEIEVQCTPFALPTAAFTSHTAPDGGFKAHETQQWFWAGCTCYVVINHEAKELLLIDSYVSKAVFGFETDNKLNDSHMTRIYRYVGFLNQMLANGYRIIGLLTSHDHGDHIGDLPRIFELLKVTHPAFPVFMSKETHTSKCWCSPGPRSEYFSHSLSKCTFQTRGKSFTDLPPFVFGSFTITPYIWYHGFWGDGIRDDRRTFAYRIETGNPQGSCITFITTGFCERPEQVIEIDKTISCHHLIFAKSSAKLLPLTAKVEFLPIAGSQNHLFTTHTDANRSMGYNATAQRSEVSALFGEFLRLEKCRVINNQTFWGDTQIPFCLGYWSNRLGDA